MKTVIDYAHRFGITPNIPPYLPVALGAVEVTPMEQIRPIACSPDDGVHITPRYITKVTDYEGRTLEENFPDVKDVISARTARTMTAMLREVVLHGTAIAASSMKYPWRERPAQPTISPMPGLSGSRPPSLVECGLVTTRRNSSVQRRLVPALPYPSGWIS